jgi:type II secretory pathway pseudopilin PulG
MKPDQGSAFVDAVVSAAILALVLGTSFQVLSDSIVRQRRLSQTREAVLVAESVLATVGSEIPAAPGQSRGKEGDLSWAVEITPWAGLNADSPAFALVSVKVKVAPLNGGPTLAGLETVRLRTAS